MKIARVIVVAAIVSYVSPHAFATDGNWSVDASGTWSNAANWTSNPTAPGGAGSTVGITYNITADRTVTLDTSETVGILNIGDADTTNSYSLGAINGATLILDNSGSGAQINDVSTALKDSISAPIVMNDNLTISDNATGATSTLSISGAITGTGTLTLDNNNTNGSGNVVVVTGNINNAGTIVDNSTGAGTLRLQGGIGSNVTEIDQNSSTSQLYFAGTGITVSSGGTKIVLTAGSTAADGGTGFVGTGNGEVDNDTNTNDALTIGGPNNVGTVTSAGTGTGHVQFSGGIGANVTELIVASGANSGIEARNGNLNINTGGATYLIDNSSSATADIEIKQAIAGTGNLVLEANGSAGITIGENQVNNTGYVINQGTGSGAGNINEGGPSIGANVKGVIENSTTSSMDIRLSNATGFTGTLEVEQGTMQIDGSNSNFTGASQVIVGDTAAHAASAKLNLNIDGGTYTMGSTQTLSGFGTVASQNVATTAGTTIAPGSAGNIGDLTVSKNLTLANGTSLTFLLGTGNASPASSIGSELTIGGSLNLPDTSLNLDLVDNANANSQGSLGAGTYELIGYTTLTGVSAGDITSLFDITAPLGYSYAVSDTGLSNGQIDLTVTATAAVPEPGTWALLLGGVGLLAWMKRRSVARARA